MGLENGKGYSRQAYENTEKGIKDVVDSIDASAPVEQLREKFAEQNELVGEKETLHNEAWDQAVAENTARDEAKVSQEMQKAAEQSEAAELLKKMHENAGIKPESAIPNGSSQEDPKAFSDLSGLITSGELDATLANIGPRLDKSTKYSVEQKEALSKVIEKRSQELKEKGTERLAQQEKEEELNKLYESLNLPPNKQGADNLYSRESVDKEGGIGHKIDQGLRGEIYNDRKKREKFAIGSAFTGGFTTLASLGALIASGTEASVFGYSGAALATAGFGIGAAGLGILAVGGLGWAGMKAWHAYKERRHEKKFLKLAHGY